jgi:hypothetical protein
VNNPFFFTLKYSIFPIIFFYINKSENVHKRNEGLMRAFGGFASKIAPRISRKKKLRGGVSDTQDGESGNSV